MMETKQFIRTSFFNEIILRNSERTLKYVIFFPSEIIDVTTFINVIKIVRWYPIRNYKRNESGWSDMIHRSTFASQKEDRERHIVSSDRAVGSANKHLWSTPAQKNLVKQLDQFPVPGKFIQ